jgi:DNA helicase HerA-like ATPase
MSTTDESNGNGSESSTDSTETITVGEDGETLPVVELLTGRGFLTGKSGSGKSNSMSVVAEQLLDGGYPLMIVDTDGEYYGLKEQYELLHVGADEECDIQVTSDHAEKLASLALEKNVPIILDLSGFLKDEDANALLLAVARHLFAKAKKLKQPFLLAVEEIHEYVPEGGGLSDVGEMLVKIAKRGRKHGLGITGISQRPANVKKDFITQCDWMVWHRLTWHNDTKVVKRILGSEYADAIEDMSDGEAFVVTDWNDAVRRMQWQRKQTFDAGATPGLEDFERPDLKTVSDDLVGELEDISEAQRQREDELARKDRRIEELEAELESVCEDLNRAREMGDMAEQFTEALLERDDSDNGNATETTIKAEVAEIREEKNERIAELESALADRDETIEDLRAHIAELEPKAERVDRLADVDLDVADEALTRIGEALGLDAASGLSESDEQAYRETIESLRERIEELEGQREGRAADLSSDPLENRRVKRFVQGKKEALEDLSETKRTMLKYYVLDGPADAADAYKYAGNDPSSNRRKRYSDELVELGFLSSEGDEQYDYALRETVRSELGDHFSEAELDVVIDRVEDLVDGSVLEGE